MVNWEDDGKEIREYNNYLNSSRASNIGIANTEYYFMEGMTWSALTSGIISLRYVPNGYIFDSKGSSCFAINKADTLPILGYLNSKVAMVFLDVIAPTLDFGPGSVSRVPFRREKSPKNSQERVTACIESSKADWDSYENSWDFTRNPLV